MVPLHLDHDAEPRRQTALSAGDLAFLNQLRFVAMACRTKPRADLFEACALLQVDRNASQAAHAEALMRCLPEALDKPARLLTPGADELTFDEKWLLELGRAIARSDHGSAAFLVGRRVQPQHRRLVLFLVRHISECFSLI